MALVKCKECGEDVSTKAKTCPKCGAKAPKGTSIISWLALIAIIFTVFVANQDSTATKKSMTSLKAENSATDSLEKAKPPKKTTLPKPSWSVSTSKDEMTGKFSAYAHSPVTYPSKVMSFPYGDVNGWMGAGCDSKSEWVYFGFNTAPNLTNDETKDGYNLIKTRIRWNDKVENVTLTQDWGAQFINFQNDNAALLKVASSNVALLELQWHGEQSTYFKFSLSGSSKALTEIRAKCVENKQIEN